MVKTVSRLILVNSKCLRRITTFTVKSILPVKTKASECSRPQQVNTTDCAIGNTTIINTGAPNDGFLSDPLKRYFRLSLKLHFRLRYNIFICSVILGELESFRNYYGIFVHFSQTFGLISFPKILADLFSVPETTFLSIPKH